MWLTRVRLCRNGLTHNRRGDSRWRRCWFVRSGWRFNQPEGEVLMKLSDTLPLLQPGAGHILFIC
jgi:hypothetical protein